MNTCRGCKHLKWINEKNGWCQHPTSAQGTIIAIEGECNEWANAGKKRPNEETSAKTPKNTPYREHAGQYTSHGYKLRRKRDSDWEKQKLEEWKKC